MIEIENVFTKHNHKKRTSFSLFGKLAMVGNYFLSEVTNGVFGGLWNSIYFDTDIGTETECIKCIDKNLIGYVDKEIRWAFILDKYIEKFKKDTSEYGLEYIGVPSLKENIIKCTHTNNLPNEFSKVLWIDDDFMYNENIPFDFDMFDIIDEGVLYLNPKHFSVNMFVKITQ